MVTLSSRRLAAGSLWLVLLPAYGVLDLIMPVAVRSAREPAWEAQGLAIQMACLMASYGTMVGQWSVLAVWSALRPSRWLVTIMLSWAVASALFAIYLRSLIQLQAASIDHPGVWFVPLALLMVQLPFLGCRAIFGWRLSRGDLSSNERLRFTIRDLFAVTAAVAVILAVSRVAASSSTGGGLGGGPMNAPPGHGLRWDYQRGQTAACISFALIGLGIVWPVFFSLFATRRGIASLIVVADLLCASALISAASWYLRPGMSFAAFAWNFAAPVLTSWNEPNGGQSFIQLFIAVAGLICGWAAVAMPSFLAFCLTGYRLNSARRNA